MDGINVEIESNPHEIIAEEERKQRRQSTWEEYKKLLKGKFDCPALGCKVQFSRWAWQHLSEPGVRQRTKEEIDQRLELLPHAKEIIESQTTTQKVKKTPAPEGRNNKKLFVLEGVIKMGADGILKRVQVILEEIKGEKFFYSIAPKNSWTKGSQKITDHTEQVI